MPTRQAGEAGGVVRMGQSQVAVITGGAQEEAQASGTCHWRVEIWQAEAVLRQLCVGPVGEATVRLRLRKEGCRELVEGQGRRRVRARGGSPGASRAARGGGAGSSLPAR